LLIVQLLLLLLLLLLLSSSSSSYQSAALNLVITPSVADISLNYAMYLALIVCFVSVVAAFYLFYFDKKAESIVRPQDDDIAITAFPSLSDIKRLPGTVWYLAAITVLYYISVFVWVQYAMYVRVRGAGRNPIDSDTVAVCDLVDSDFLKEYYNVSAVVAGPLISIPYWVAAVLCPLFRSLQQRVGFSLLFCMLVGLPATRTPDSLALCPRARPLVQN
jgi:hypothetical protein